MARPGGTSAADACRGGAKKPADNQASPRSAALMMISVPDDTRLPSPILLKVVADQRQRGTTLGAVKAAQGIAATQPQRLPEQRPHGRTPEPAVLPAQIDLESATRPQASRPAVRPRGGKRRQQANLSLVALQQHL